MTETLNDTPLHPPVRSEYPEGALVMPSGNWVVARDPKTLTRGDRKELSHAASDPEVDGFQLYDRLAAKLITAWSYPYPLPAQQLDVMDQLPIEDDDEISKLVKVAEALLFPKRKVTPDDHADPRSPSEPSSD